MKCRLSRSATGFTLIELLVVVAIIAAMAAILVPSFSQALALAKRTKCGANVRDLTRACLLYANESRYHRNQTAQALPSTGPDTDNCRSWNSGNPASLWLLISTNVASTKVALCPSAAKFHDVKEPNRDDGVFKPETYSYSYLSQVPFTHEQEYYPVTSLGNKNTLSNLVILADRSPYWETGFSGADDQKNSMNHNADGQNVGKLDGSAQWLDTPKDSGDNIYLPVSGDPSDGRRWSPEDIFLIR